MVTTFGEGLLSFQVVKTDPVTVNEDVSAASSHNCSLEESKERPLTGSPGDAAGPGAAGPGAAGPGAAGPGAAGARAAGPRAAGPGAAGPGAAGARAAGARAAGPGDALVGAEFPDCVDCVGAPGIVELPVGVVVVATEVASNEDEVVVPGDGTFFCCITTTIITTTIITTPRMRTPAITLFLLLLVDGVIGPEVLSILRLLLLLILINIYAACLVDPEVPSRHRWDSITQTPGGCIVYAHT